MIFKTKAIVILTKITLLALFITSCTSSNFKQKEISYTVETADSVVNETMLVTIPPGSRFPTSSKNYKKGSSARFQGIYISDISADYYKSLDQVGMADYYSYRNNRNRPTKKFNLVQVKTTWGIIGFYGVNDTSTISPDKINISSLESYDPDPPNGMIVSDVFIEVDYDKIFSDSIANPLEVFSTLPLDVLRAVSWGELHFDWARSICQDVTLKVFELLPTPEALSLARYGFVGKEYYSFLLIHPSIHLSIDNATVKNNEITKNLLVNSKLKFIDITDNSLTNGSGFSVEIRLSKTNSLVTDQVIAKNLIEFARIDSVEVDGNSNKAQIHITIDEDGRNFKSSGTHFHSFQGTTRLSFYRNQKGFLEQLPYISNLDLDLQEAFKLGEQMIDGNRVEYFGIGSTADLHLSKEVRDASYLGLFQSFFKNSAFDPTVADEDTRVCCDNPYECGTGIVLGNIIKDLVYPEVNCFDIPVYEKKAVFDDRSLIVPEFAIYLSDQLIYVRAGTTLRTLMQNYNIPQNFILNRSYRGGYRTFKNRNLNIVLLPGDKIN